MKVSRFLTAWLDFGIIFPTINGIRKIPKSRKSAFWSRASASLSPVTKSMECRFTKNPPIPPQAYKGTLNMIGLNSNVRF